jgi:hypothetical protein
MDEDLGMRRATSYLPPRPTIPPCSRNTLIPGTQFKRKIHVKSSLYIGPTLHCKKIIVFPVPSRDPNSHWPGIIKLFPARESLVSDIPAGDRKNDNLFYSVATPHYVSK